MAAVIAVMLSFANGFSVLESWFPKSNVQGFEKRLWKVFRIPPSPLAFQLQGAKGDFIGNLSR
jgi:hypothetical protein